MQIYERKPSSFLEAEAVTEVRFKSFFQSVFLLILIYH
jgi:hypothetical protein